VIVPSVRWIKRKKLHTCRKGPDGRNSKNDRTRKGGRTDTVHFWEEGTLFIQKGNSELDGAVGRSYIIQTVWEEGPDVSREKTISKGASHCKYEEFDVFARLVPAGVEKLSVP